MNDILNTLDRFEALVNQALSAVRQSCAGDDGKLKAAQLDEHQQVTSELSVSTAELQCAKHYLSYAEGKGELEQTLAATFAAESLHNIRNRLLRAPADYGLTDDAITSVTLAACGSYLSARSLEALGRMIVDRNGDIGDRGLDEEKALMADTFRQFAEDVVKPLAEGIHRQDKIIPDEILNGVRELGCFGLSVPQQYGGLLPDDKEDSLGMIVVTEELSRGSLGGAGSLITRPEIMARALMEGGTEEQKSHWLPRIATGNPLCAIAITEPDYGSDVASIKLKATQTEDGWLLNGAKAWSTFAGKSEVLLTLARTDPDPSMGHRGLSLFMVEKPAFDGDEFRVKQPGGGELSGKSIPTLGYRGMHSFNLFFDDFFVPASHMIGEEQGVGKGFYFTMRGFTGGRIQTAARACGVMQAAFETGLSYAKDRKVFGKPVADYQLTLIKFAKMAMYLGACRQFTYEIGRMMDEGRGQMEASLVKLLACKLSEWTAREAMQIHGGMGYAEECAASRYWLDARVLSIFEGTEETLALKVVGRSLIEQAA
ncbi:MAG: (2S)-methylsuccinyl-CoA dehydrogenase [Candidatus Azotimanducaceae bacterium]|jgi:(2S)-methylsuccinyl-CoA dehydrogenase